MKILGSPAVFRPRHHKAGTKATAALRPIRLARRTIRRTVTALSFTALTALASLASIPAPALAGDVVAPDLGVSVKPSVLTIREGRDRRFLISLNSRPSAKIVVGVHLRSGGQQHFSLWKSFLTFFPETWNRPQRVRITALTDANAIDETAEVVFTATSDADGSTAEITAKVRARDADEAAIVVTPTSLEIDEGASDQLSVALGSKPQTDVEVQVAPDGTGRIETDRTLLKFGPESWSQPQTVTVSALQDADTVDDDATIEFTASGADYDEVASVTATARVIDDDTPAHGLPEVVVTPTVLTADEGRTATYDVTLSTRPQENVVVQASPDPSRVITIDRPRLEFTPTDWDTPRTVTLRVLEDADSWHTTVYIKHLVSAAGGQPEESASVRVQTVDDDLGLPAQLTGHMRLEAFQPRVVAYFCFTPSGIDPGWLSDFQIASVHGDEEPNPAHANPLDGVFVYRPVTSWIGRCNGGRGATLSERFQSNMPHLVRVRARSGSDWVVSDLATIRVFDPSVVLGARLRGEGFTGVNSDGEPVFPDVPETVHGEFEIAVAFGFHLDFSTHTDEVSGLGLNDFVATNATLSAPPGGFEYQRSLGYRLRVTPTTLGEDVTVQVRAGAVIEPYSGSTNDASNVFRRRTAPAPALAARSGVEVSAVDASTKEERDAVLSFPVRLNASAGAPVTVRYATADGTARAGEDYVKSSGTLTFAPGEVEHHVDVEVLDDLRNEGDEWLSLTLSDPNGASLGTASATGSILNSDPLPQAWLTRFGRTVAAQAVDTIGARLDGEHGTRVVIAGATLEPGKSAAADPDGSVQGWPHGSSAFEHRNGGRTSTRAQETTALQLALASEFQFASERAEHDPVWSAWGRTAADRFDAAPDGLALDGDVLTGFLGFDVAHERWLAGLAVSLSRGDGGFEPRERNGGHDAGAGARGQIESRLTSLYPYAGYRLTERTDVWGMLGYGTGDVTVTEPAGDGRVRDVVNETGTGMRMGALGAKSRILSSERQGLEVSLRTDAFWVRTESDAVESLRSGRLEASSGDATRVRLLLEGSRMFELGDSGLTFTPSAEVGVRHDGGDAETGTGMVAGASARFASPWVAMDIAVRSLVTHEDRGLEGWGASGSLRVRPGTGGRGLSLGIAPAWGVPGLGAEQIGSQLDPSRLPSDRAFEFERRLTAELGYGLAAPAGRGLLTPYTGATWADDRTPNYRLGVRWDLDPRTTLRLEGTRGESGTGDGSQSALSLRAAMRW